MAKEAGQSSVIQSFIDGTSWGIKDGTATPYTSNKLGVVDVNQGKREIGLAYWGDYENN